MTRVALASSLANEDWSDQDRGVAQIRSLTAFFPCYNDAQSIGQLVVRTHDLLRDCGLPHEILVIDDGSMDSSVAVVTELCRHIPELRLIRHPRNLGYGAVLQTGFREAASEWVFYTDGDGQYDPGELSELIAEVSPEVDVVQGYKRSRQDGIGRAVIGRLYHHAVKAFFRLPIRDTDCDFRLIRSGVIRRAELRQSSGAICVEMVRYLTDLGARFVEVPVHHFPRVHGRSQFFRVGRVLRSLSDLAQVWVQWRRRLRAANARRGV